jgi:hypothetical protein
LAPENLGPFPESPDQRVKVAEVATMEFSRARSPANPDLMIAIERS